jgi:hypothetical protein
MDTAEKVRMASFLWNVLVMRYSPGLRHPPRPIPMMAIVKISL